MMTAPGQQQQGRIVETVQSRQNGRVLLIEGQGRTGQGEATDRLIHDALGIISYDPGGARYVMRAYRDGLSTDSELVLTDDGLEWGFDDPRAGRIRYRVSLTPDSWHETGAFSRDGGATWTDFMEMKLKKVR